MIDLRARDSFPPLSISSLSSQSDLVGRSTRATKWRSSSLTGWLKRGALSDTIKQSPRALFLNSSKEMTPFSQWNEWTEWEWSLIEMCNREKEKTCTGLFPESFARSYVQLVTTVNPGIADKHHLVIRFFYFCFDLIKIEMNEVNQCSQTTLSELVTDQNSRVQKSANFLRFLS